MREVGARRPSDAALAVVALLAALAGCAGSDEKRYAELHQGYTRSAEAEMKQAVGRAGDQRIYVVQDLPPVPPDLAPWWAAPVGQPLYPEAEPQSCALDDLYVRTIKHASQIQAFADIPLIRETGIQEAQGRFDVRAFLDAKYENVDEPVGSLLTSEVSDEFRQRTTTAEAGVRWRAPTGAEMSLSERLTHIGSNSEFLVPEPQTQARLTLSIVQPLLKGGGVQYNRSILYIAGIDSEVAQAEFLRQTQSHLLAVCSAYWGLFQARAEFLIRRQLVQDTEKLLARIRERTDLDAARLQVVRAESAFASRKVLLVRTELSIRNAEDRVRALVNDDDLRRSSTLELLPATALALAERPLDPGEAAATAIQHRPEISQGISQLRAVAVREAIAKNELMPQLNLILEGSLRGLAREGDVGDALENETDQPNYLVGLSFEVPLGNNEAQARHRRRQIELRQQLNQLRTATETVLLEVKVAVREMATAYREMQGKYQALIAAQEDLRTLEERWGMGGAGGQAGAAYLDLLLDSQNRVAVAEEDLMRSAVAYNVSMMTLERAQGTLLDYLDLHPARREGRDGLPELFLEPGSRPATGQAEPSSGGAGTASPSSPK